MQLINNPIQIDVEVLMSRLRQRGTITERFRLPMSKEQATKILISAIQAEVEYRCRKFEMNRYVAQQAEMMADCLTADNSNFGVLLCGGCGNGKSTFVKAFQQILNQLNLKSEDYRHTWNMRIMDARTIANLCKSSYKEFEELRTLKMLAVDDLGTEPLEMLDYGNVLSPMVDLLTKRYDLQLFTIVTTNLTPQEIRTKYGDRIADRLNEMMVKIIFENPTYRQNTFTF